MWNGQLLQRVVAFILMYDVRGYSSQLISARRRRIHDTRASLPAQSAKHWSTPKCVYVHSLLVVITSTQPPPPHHLWRRDPHPHIHRHKTGGTYNNTTGARSTSSSHLMRGCLQLSLNEMEGVPPRNGRAAHQRALPPEAVWGAVERKEGAGCWFSYICFPIHIRVDDAQCAYTDRLGSRRAANDLGARA